MSRISDPVSMRHPALPGVVVETSARSFPARARRGWVEVKSPSAKKATVEPTSPDGEPLTPSQEEQK